MKDWGFNEDQVGVSNKSSQEPDEGLLKLIVALGRDIVVLEVLLSVESDLLSLDLSVLDIDLVSNQDDRNVLTDSDEIGTIIRAARSFTYAKAWAEAIPLLEKEILWGKNQEEGKPIRYLCALALAGICHWRLGQPTRTLELVREILDGLQTPFEEDPNELISCLVSLGKRCMENSSFAEAGQLLGGSMLLADQLPEVSQHAKQMVNGAISGFLAQGQPKEELKFNPSVLSSANEQN